MIRYTHKSPLAFVLLLLIFSTIISCGEKEEDVDNEPDVASENVLRFESGAFDSLKPTIVFFGGGNCVNSWKGTESWDNEETVGSEWFDRANVISFYSYRMDPGSSDTTYFNAATLVTDTILSLAPDYQGNIQACGFSTGGTPALDLGIHINLDDDKFPFKVRNITLMDAPCYDYTQRFQSLTSTTEHPMIVNLIGGLYKEYRQPYPGILNVDVLDGHDDVFWWYVNSISTENGNDFNNGITGGVYLSVIGEGSNIRIPFSDEASYYFDWQGGINSGEYRLYDGHKYPKTLDLPYLTVSENKGIPSMGKTLIHEHLLVDFIGADRTGYHRWDRGEVIPKLLPLLNDLKEYGVETFLDCTPAYSGRDPILLQELSEKTGLNILTNTGFYGAVNDKYLPLFTHEVSADSLASIWISEFENGIEGTGIRPGFMKISVDPDEILSDVDERILRAAIITHKQTGMTIVSHTGPNGPAMAQMDILEEEGLSLSAWVWTHASEGTDAGRISAAKKGAWISIDDVHQDNITDIVGRLQVLQEENLLHRVLISHDAGWFDPDDPLGEEIRGYTDIFEYLIPSLLSNGFSKEEIEMLLVSNPSEAYQIKVRKSEL